MSLIYSLLEEIENLLNTTGHKVYVQKVNESGYDVEVIAPDGYNEIIAKNVSMREVYKTVRMLNLGAKYQRRKEQKA